MGSTAPKLCQVHVQHCPSIAASLKPLGPWGDALSDKSLPGAGQTGSFLEELVNTAESCLSLRTTLT